MPVIRPFHDFYAPYEPVYVPESDKYISGS